MGHVHGSAKPNQKYLNNSRTRYRRGAGNMHNMEKDDFEVSYIIKV